MSETLNPRAATPLGVAVFFVCCMFSSLAAHAGPEPIDPNTACGNGCWLYVTDDTGFDGEEAVFCGPLKSNNMVLKTTEAIAEDWDDRIESLHTGPLATVTAWEDDGYVGERAIYAPMTILRDLDDNDMDGEIGSLKIDCMAPASPVALPAISSPATPDSTRYSDLYAPPRAASFQTTPLQAKPLYETQPQPAPPAPPRYSQYK